jgi:hypothetical protein
LSAPSNNKHSVVGTALASVGHLIYLLIKALPRYAFGAWVALVLAVAIGFWKIESVTEANHKLAVQAQHLSKQVAHEQQLNERARTERRRLTDRTTLLICRKQNTSNKILADLLKQIASLPPNRSQTPDQQANRKKILRSFAAALIRLKPQQCNHLPSTPKKSQAPGG